MREDKRKRPNAARQRWTSGLTKQPVKEIVWLRKVYARTIERARCVEYHSMDVAFMLGIVRQNVEIKEEGLSKTRHIGRGVSQIYASRAAHLSRLLATPFTALLSALINQREKRLSLVVALGLGHSPVCIAIRSTSLSDMTVMGRSIAQGPAPTPIRRSGISEAFLLSCAYAVSVIAHSLGFITNSYVLKIAVSEMRQIFIRRNIQKRNHAQSNANFVGSYLIRRFTAIGSFAQRVVGRIIKVFFVHKGAVLQMSEKRIESLQRKFLSVMGGGARYA